MGYLDNSTTIVDAILTKHGRKVLSDGQPLNIKYFCFSDDMVDYRLWNPEHGEGSPKYGEAITELPLLEAVPDDSVLMKYKLTTLPRNTIFLPRLRVTTPLTIVTAEDSVTLDPRTENGTDSQYEFVFTDVSPFIITGGTKVEMSGVSGQFLSRADISHAAIYRGKHLKIKAKTTDVTQTVTVHVTGFDTGAVESIDITANPNLLKRS